MTVISLILPAHFSLGNLVAGHISKSFRQLLAASVAGLLLRCAVYIAMYYSFSQPRTVLWQMYLVTCAIFYACTGMAYVLSQVGPVPLGSGQASGKDSYSYCSGFKARWASTTTLLLLEPYAGVCLSLLCCSGLFLGVGSAASDVAVAASHVAPSSGCSKPDR